MADIDTEIRAILRRYGVRSHYLATKAAIRPAGDGKHYIANNQYAVWRDGRQVTEPAIHKVAKEDMENLIIADIKALGVGRD